MGDVAIRVENLGKQYRIGGQQARYNTLRDSLSDAMGAPFRRISSVLRGESTNHRHETIWALKDVSFEVKKGEVVGIIGRNGAGKSTLLKVLSRITEPTEGTVDLFGRVGSLLEVGTGFHPELTGRENIYLNGAILGMKKVEIERKFDEIVDFSGVEKFIDTPVKHYSSGMYVRLAFAVAAHMDPEILLVDEVLAVGDAAFQKKCLGKMGEVAEEGRTVLFVSHNMGAVSSLCPSCIWLQQGIIAGTGETERIIGAYIGHTSREMPGGFVDLRSCPRSLPLNNRHAQFEWVRTLNAKGMQTDTFTEGEPITIEMGFRLEKETSSLQSGVSIGSVDGSVWLFTIPSPELHDIAAGKYTIRLSIRPNYLRNGNYTLALKLFSDGTRQDTIGQVLRFNIEPYLSSDDNSAYRHRWVAGYMRFDYEWEPIITGYGIAA